MPAARASLGPTCFFCGSGAWCVLGTEILYWVVREFEECLKRKN